MIAEIDIWRSAQLMVKQHGDAAGGAARQRAFELDGAGDADGHAVWLRINAAIEDLQRMPGDGEPVN